MKTIKFYMLCAIFMVIWAICTSHGIIGLVFGWMPAGIITVFVANLIL